jgi:hypothetical protein
MSVNERARPEASSSRRLQADPREGNGEPLDIAASFNQQAAKAVVSHSQHDFYPPSRTAATSNKSRTEPPEETPRAQSDG